jgi:mannose-6-phosphate isomerase-like protein (cupin superfamily)
MSYVLSIALMFGAADTLEAAQQRRTARTATLAVVVSDPSGAPINDVLVTVDRPAPRSLRTEGGKIVFEGVPAGAYRLRFEHARFVTLERELTAPAGKPTEVKVTLNPVPPAPEPPSEPAPPPAPDINASPVTLDLPAVLEKEFIGRAPSKVTALTCAAGGTARLIQVREPLVQETHADSDEFIYVIAGEGTAALNGTRNQLHAGVFVLVPRGVPHTIAMTGRNPLMLLSTRAGEPCSQ